MTTTGFRHWLTVATVLIFPAVSARANNPGGRYTIGTGSILDTKTNLTWQQPAPTVTYAWSDAKAYCPTLGAGWRLPTIKELLTLVDYSQSGSPKIDSVFSGTAASFYWSSTVRAGAPSLAWSVAFQWGTTDNPGTSNLNNVRCVR